jgi:hypothetical protein
MVAVGYSNGANIAASLMLSDSMLAGADPVRFRNAHFPQDRPCPPALLADIARVDRRRTGTVGRRTGQLTDMLRSVGRMPNHAAGSHALTQAMWRRRASGLPNNLHGTDDNPAVLSRAPFFAPCASHRVRYFGLTGSRVHPMMIRAVSEAAEPPCPIRPSLIRQICLSFAGG